MSFIKIKIHINVTKKIIRSMMDANLNTMALKMPEINQILGLNCLKVILITIMK